MTGFWDLPDMQANDEYVRFETPGDTITGTVMQLSVRTFDDGKKAAQIVLDTDRGPRTLTASQTHLARLMRAHRPELGDTVTIRFDSIEKMTGGRTRKTFTMGVQRAGGAQPAQPGTWPKTAEPAAIDDSDLI